MDVEGNLVNAYVSSKTPGRVELEKIGNIKDIKEIPIQGIADISMDSDGMMMWAFTDSEETLKINPLALVQQDSDVRPPHTFFGHTSGMHQQGTRVSRASWSLTCSHALAYKASRMIP